MQLQVLRTMVSAFNDYRGTYNVSDYRWFDLRDADSSSPNFQQQFGLLRDDYSPKPAFAAYASLVGGLSVSGSAAGNPAGGTPQRPSSPGHERRSRHRVAGLVLRIRSRSRSRLKPRGDTRHACLHPPLVASLSGRGVVRVRSVTYFVAGRRAGGATRPPFRSPLAVPDLGPGARVPVRAIVTGRAGRRLPALQRTVRVCRIRGR
jgi:hypothetical protein